ncbi:MAG: hypothetical protein C4542_00895 [Dehalococcoidia bacterium]|nr:MAG: hypothetical protein C4542_00895 [Dehalococcoidia bacterium]
MTDFLLSLPLPQPVRIVTGFLLVSADMTQGITDFLVPQSARRTLVMTMEDDRQYFFGLFYVLFLR